MLCGRWKLWTIMLFLMKRLLRMLISQRSLNPWRNSLGTNPTSPTTKRYFTSFTLYTINKLLRLFYLTSLIWAINSCFFFRTKDRYWNTMKQNYWSNKSWVQSMRYNPNIAQCSYFRSTFEVFLLDLSITTSKIQDFGKRKWVLSLNQRYSCFLWNKSKSP